MKISPSSWFKAGAIAQCVTGCIHSLSLVSSPEPKNDTEKQLFELMSGYAFDMGAGFSSTMDDFMNSFSISFSLFLFFSGILNLFLLRSQLPAKTLRGVVLINLVAHSICFITMSVLTFLPPIVCTGVIVLLLLLAYVGFRREITAN